MAMPSLAANTESNSSRVRIVVEKHQRGGVTFPRHLHPFFPRRMPPAFFCGGQLFGSELRIIHKNIRARRQFRQALVQLGIARLVIGGIHHGACRSLDAESQAALRVIQPARGNFVFPDAKRVAAVHFLELALGVHCRHVHREIRQRHLRFENLLQAVAAQKFRTETIKVKVIIFGVQRREKWDSLDVVPVIVGHQNMRFRSAFPVGRGPAAAQHAQSGAAIQNNLYAVRGD